MERPSEVGGASELVDRFLAGRAERTARAYAADLDDFARFRGLPRAEAVREPVIINPDPRLERVAKKRGWRIETW